MSSPAAKLTTPDGKELPIKSCKSVGLLPEPVTVYSAELDLEVSPVRVTVKRNVVVSPGAPSGCADASALMLRVGGGLAMAIPKSLLLEISAPTVTSID